ncbi:MAG: hypothetical protein ACKVS9_17345 [Phycisphaerae bacterium]
MRLKLRYSGCVGARRSDFVDSLLRASLSHAQALRINVPHESYDSLRFWTEVLIAARDHAGLMANFGGDDR